MKFVQIPILAIGLFTISACVARVPPLAPIVSDFCLVDKRVLVAPAPQPGVDDPRNQWDTEETVHDVVQHNAVYDKICPEKTNAH